MAWFKPLHWSLGLCWDWDGNWGSCGDENEGKEGGIPQMGTSVVCILAVVNSVQ